MNTKENFIYLQKHFKYATLNSWNGLYSIARNVKIHNLDLPESAYDMLDIQEYQWGISDLIQDFEDNNKDYEIGFNGRSGGYIVLYNKENTSSAISNIYDYDTFEDLQEYYDIEDIEYIISKDIEIVKKFNILVDDCISTLKWYCDNFEVEEIEEEVIKKKKKTKKKKRS